jgi:hypothetical protein
MFLNAVNDFSNPNIGKLVKELVEIQQETKLYLLSILYDYEEDEGNNIDFILSKVLGFEAYYDVTLWNRLHWFSSSCLKIKMF